MIEVAAQDATNYQGNNINNFFIWFIKLFFAPATNKKLSSVDSQRWPTHSPLATRGEWSFKCGEWLYFQMPPNWAILEKTEQK